MRSPLKLVVAAVLTAVLSTGCMLSRAVDRAFVGMSVKRPAHNDRKVTGIFLLPITFAIDLATFPIQAILVAILGDNFPFNDPPSALDGSGMASLQGNPQFEKLEPAAQQTAIAELDALVKSGQLDANSALALTEDGHWVVVRVTDEARQQLIARTATAPNASQVCAR